jgi:hypothetical protein
MKTKAQVLKHLKESMECRDDDKLLRKKVWEDFGFYLTKDQEELYWSLPADGAISRRRREAREQYPESIEVMEKRYHLFKKVRDEHSTFPKRLFGWIR